MLHMYRFGHALIELATSFAQFLGTPVLMPVVGFDDLGRFIITGVQFYSLAEVLIGAGFITLLMVKLFKYFISIGA